MPSKELLKAVEGYENYIQENGIDEDVINAYVLASDSALMAEHEKEYGLKVSARAKELIETFVLESTGGTCWDLEKYCFKHKVHYDILDKYFSVLKIEAQNMVLDSYFQYLERKREPKDRFYMPKRRHFLKLGLIQALQDMLDDKLDLVSISMPPGTQKTTLEKFFNSGVIGWFPDDFNLFFSHSGDIARMYYDGVLDIVDNDDEYCWKEIFEGLKVTSTNAKMQQFNVGKYKPFPSLQTTSVGSENAGKVRASKFLLCDDLIGKLEEALNKNTLDKIWSIYSVDARQRKLDGCKEIHIATRWSVNDVIGRLERLYEGNPRCKFISVPDIDPETGKSNFDYEYMGFTVEFFKDQALAMDDISYKCLYKNQPVEREGLLYHDDDLRRFVSLPAGEPDAILGVCDTKAKGADYFVLPCIYKYGEDYYLVDCLCNKDSNYETQYEKVVNIVCTNNMQSLEIEANMGGDRIAHEVKERLDSIGQRCNITTKYTETNKETRIIVNAEWIKSHVLFKDKQDYGAKSEYGEFMSQLLSYSVEGKNKHDDVPDAMANFVLFVTRNLYRKQSVVIKCPL